MKKLSSILIVISALLLLSSCTSFNEVDENAVKDVSDKITEAIINTVGKDSVEKQESFNIAAENINSLNIESSVGDITIKTHESTEAIIGLNIIAKSSSKENAQKLIDEFSFKVDENLNSIDIDTTFEDDKLLDNSNIQTELTISLPKNINNFTISLNVGDIDIINNEGNFEINNNVGDINVENAAGSYDLSTNVGNITLINSIASGTSNFNSNTGDLEVSFSDISNSDNIKANLNVGEIKFTVP
ncbi:MAG: hypothetical protein K0R07_2188, partial [Sedimentibacter sp.]|nr:hypothetical protein [Sedimentibacter sp.]